MNRVWVYKTSLTLFIYNLLIFNTLTAQEKQFIQFHSPHFTTPCLVNNILFDDSQNMWLAMENGLLKLPAQSIQTDSPPESILFTEQNSAIRQHHINCLWSSDGKKIWAGTYSRGLIMLDSAENFHHFPFSNDKILLITAISQTAQGQILVATQTDGVYALSEEKLMPLFNSSNSKLLSNHVNFISSDWAGQIWFGTENGISVFDSHKQKWQNHPKTGNTQSIQQLGNQIFASSITHEGPIFWKLERKGWQQVGSGIFKFNFRLKDIVPSSQQFWITSDRGLIQFDGEASTLFDQRHKLPKGEISHVAIAPDSSLWLATTTGLYQWADYTEPEISFPSVADSLVENQLLRLHSIHFIQSQALLADYSDDSELKKIAQHLVSHPNQLIEIHGHTDNRGNQLANWELSKSRTQTIAELLIELGVPKSNIKTIWHGETQPLLPNTTEANRQQNRRVEIKLVSIMNE